VLVFDGVVVVAHAAFSSPRLLDLFVVQLLLSSVVVVGGGGDCCCTDCFW
jgi:hypothetical protein